MLTLRDIIVNGYYLTVISIDYLSSSLRFSIRRPDRKAERSDLRSRSFADSNSFGEGVEAEERGAELRPARGERHGRSPKLKTG